MKRLLRRFLIWSGSVISTSTAFAQSSKIAPDLLGLLGGLLAPTNVVIQYNSAPTLLNVTKLLSLGGVINAQYVSIPAIAVKLPAVVVQVLALDPAVAYISPDRAVAGTLDLTTAAVNADIAYQAGYTGAGVGIAIVDSGIYAHPDLAGRIVYRQSFIGGVNNDDYGHGTHVAGIAAGSGASSNGPQFTRTFRGVAPGAHLIDLRALDANGMSTDSVILSAIDKAISFAVAVQHPGAESVDRAADFRELPAGSDLRGGGGGVETGHHGGGGGGQSGPQRIRDHYFAGEQPERDHGGRDEDRGDAEPE